MMTTKARLLSLATVAVLIGVSGCGSTEEPTASETNEASPSPAAPSEPSPSPEPAESSPAPSESAPSPAESSPPAPPEKPVAITIEGFMFSGPKAVAPGTPIMVPNEDPAAHSVTADGGEFDVLVQASGGGTPTFKAPTKPGKYPYICKFHPDMMATLVVK